MKATWIWPAAAAAVLTSTGCMTMAEYAASRDCSEYGLGSVPCQTAAEGVRDERDNAERDAWNDEEWRLQAACRQERGRWQAGRYNGDRSGGHGFCMPIPRPPGPRLSLGFLLNLQDYSAGSLQGSEPMDVQLTGSYCEAGAPTELEKGYAILARSWNLGEGGTPYVRINGAVAGPVMYDGEPHPEGGWRLTVREEQEGDLPDAGALVQRLEPGDDVRMKITFADGAVREYGGCDRSTIRWALEYQLR